jgi:iron complex outermembrane receptor protein
MYEDEDPQAICSEPDSPIVVICNTGTVVGQGIEGVWNSAFSDLWSFGVGFSWFDSEGKGMQDFCSDGEQFLGSHDACEVSPLPGIPEWTAHATLDGTVPPASGERCGSLSAFWEDDAPADWVPFTPETIAAGARECGGYTEVQAVAGYRAPARWALALYVENLLDDEYYDFEGGVSSPGSRYVQSDIRPSRPRTLELRFSWNL